MSIVRGEDRPVIERGSGLPTLQRLVNRANGSDAVTVLINHFTRGEMVPAHTYDVEEVLLVMAGECTGTVDGRQETARAAPRSSSNRRPVTPSVTPLMNPAPWSLCLDPPTFRSGQPRDARLHGPDRRGLLPSV